MTTQQDEAAKSEGARIAFLKKRKEEKLEREAREAFMALAKAPGWCTTTEEEAERLRQKVRNMANPFGTPVKRAG